MKSATKGPLSVFNKSPEVKNVKLVTIGMSGAGKSSFLNALAHDPCGPEDQEPFEANSTFKSCTQKISRGSFPLRLDSELGFVWNRGEPVLQVDLTDTMGFPDTNPEKCKAFYDAVVAECNKPQNAIVWVHTASRSNHAIIGQMRALLREFNNAQVPIILVMNGREAYPRGATSARKLTLGNQHRKNHLQMGMELAEAAGLRVDAILAGADMDDLYGCIKEELAKILLRSETRPSNIKSFEVVKAERFACKSDAEKAQREADQAEMVQRRVERQCAELERQRKEYEDRREGAAITAGVGGGVEVACAAGMVVCAFIPGANVVGTCFFVGVLAAGGTALGGTGVVVKDEATIETYNADLRTKSAEVSHLAADASTKRDLESQARMLEAKRKMEFDEMESAFPKGAEAL